MNRFVILYDECIPKKLITKWKNGKTPWIANIMRYSNALTGKQGMHKKSLHKLTDTNISKYKTYRNKLNISLR